MASPASGPVPMVVLYRPKPGCEAALEALIRAHGVALRASGLVTSVPVKVWTTRRRDGSTGFLETFEWRDPEAQRAAQADAGLQAVWTPMWALLESKDHARLDPLPGPDGRHAVPPGRSTVTTCLVVRDAAAELAFVQEAFGATVLRVTGDPDGTVRHAEVRIGDSVVRIGEARTELEARPAVVHLSVEDVDAWFARAKAAGAQVVREVADQPDGDRAGGVDDPQGNRWWMAASGG